MGNDGPTPAARRARSARTRSGSAALRAAPAASPTDLRAPRAASTLRSRTSPVRSSNRERPRPSSCSRSFITSSVCCRPTVNSACPSWVASSRVIRPRLTTSSRASSMRWRLIMTISRGRIRLLVSAWRNSATALPENSVGSDELRRGDDEGALRADDVLADPFLAAPFFPPLFLAEVFFTELLRPELFFAALLRPELFPPMSAICLSFCRWWSGLFHVEGADDHGVVRQAYPLRRTGRDLAPLGRELVWSLDRPEPAREHVVDQPRAGGRREALV